MALGRPRSGTVRVLAVVACLLFVTAGGPFALGAGLGDGTDDSIAVGAVDETDVVPPFSGGERIARHEWAGAPDDWAAPSSYTVPGVVAPGVAVESAVPGCGYEAMATPHVSGTVALLLSIDPDATPDEIAVALADATDVPDEGAVASDAEAVATR